MNFDKLYNKCIRIGILDNDGNLLMNFQQYNNYETFLEETGLTITDGIRVLDYCLDKLRSKSHYLDGREVGAKLCGKELYCKLLEGV